MRLGSNMAALISAGYLSSSERKMRASLEKLSSGYKINHSKDDAAGMAISEKMKTQIKGLHRSSMNAADGISVVQTAEGALAEIEEMLQRMNELCVQGSTESYMQEDRDNIYKEIESLTTEINRIAKDTQFNNTFLLNGDMQRKSYATTVEFDEKRLTDAARVSYFTGDVKAGSYGLTIDDEGKASFMSGEDEGWLGFSDTAILVQNDNKVVVTDVDGFEMNFTIDKEAGFSGDIVFEIWDIGTMPIQIGANEGQLLNICIPEMTAETLNLDTVDFSSADACQGSISIIQDAISKVSKVRSEIGAFQNRLEYSVASLDVTEENMTSALSRMIDVDMAKEMSSYTAYNVMHQAGISMVSQANMMPEKILQLLQ